MSRCGTEASMVSRRRGEASTVRRARRGCQGQRGRRGQRGSAAVLATVLLGVLACSAVLVAAFGGAVVAQRRVEAAADLGALAGASAALRGEPGCTAAASIASANDARVLACTVSGEIVELRVVRETRRVLGLRFTVTSRARAGPVGGGLTGTAES
ncbi:MAG TPA: Rv3654c family TadE-like protein [Nocardioidaceae bacterium]|nr:Rv3654c family TadE-like protein [Nocardioidaceae bacterium]